VTIANAFDYGGAEDDVKDLTVRLPAGLLGNPLVPARCTPEQFAADACPAGPTSARRRLRPWSPSFLPRPRAPSTDGRGLSRKSFHLRRTKLTVSLRGAGSLRLNWRSLRRSAQLLRTLNAHRATTRLTFNLRVTDARGATHALRPRLRICA
jgi:hypothetical protein